MSARDNSLNTGTFATQFGHGDKVQVQFTALVDMVDLLSANAVSKIAQIRSKKSSMSIADMFDLQMAMNRLSQFSEMSSGVIAAMNTSSMSVARNLKG